MKRIYSLKRRNNKNKFMEKLEHFLYAVVISGILTVVFPLPLVIVLFVAVLIWFLVLLQYGTTKNLMFLGKWTLLTGGLLVGYVSVKMMSGHLLREPSAVEITLFSILFFEVCSVPIFGKLLDIAKKCLHKVLHKESRDLHNELYFDEPDLYPDRVCDLQRIKDYMTLTEIMGVHGEWGQGKSFLLDHLLKEKEIQEQYEVIRIDLLSCDLDTIELILVEEIEKIFRKNRIYPEKSRSLKNLLSKNQWFDVLRKQTFGDSEGMAATFDSYTKEFGKIPKKILLVFEDIDRIEKRRTIQKIFAISEKLVGKRLHVLYFYDNNQLKKIGFKRQYLEKYIPYTVNLTQISFESLVDALWTELEMPEFVKKDQVQNIKWKMANHYQLQRLLGIDINMSLQMPAFSIRKIRIFLNELKILITKNPEFRKENVINTVISVLFIKHFLESYYRKWKIGESPLSQILFTWKNKKMTMEQMWKHFHVDKRQKQKLQEKQMAKLERLFRNTENRTNILVITLLDYDLEVKPVGNSVSERFNEPEENLKRKEKNEKIDRIVWNILANGTSEITDTENAVRKLFSEVVYASGEQQKQAWKKYLDDMYYGRLWKNNSTIFKMGMDPYLSLFRALKVSKVTDKDWEAFLDFYFGEYQKTREGKEISGKLISCLNYAELGCKRNFIKIQQFVNTLQVNYNLNKDPAYLKFYSSYMGQFAAFGYAKRMENWMFELAGSLDDNREMAETLLKELEEDLQMQKNRYTSSCIQNEYDICLGFIEKNRELIRCAQSAPAQRPIINIREARSHWHHQEEVDRLLSLKEKVKNKEITEEEFRNCVEESYREEKILLPEYECVMRET